MLNLDVFNIIKKHGAKILVVTKYWDWEKTRKILDEAAQKYPNEFFWLWENRIEIIKEKNLPRESVHFIGNIQSRKISEIIQHCWTIHSLGKISHAEKIQKLWIKTNVFIQIKLDPQKDIWIDPVKLKDFLDQCKTMDCLKIIWISGMGSWDFSEDKKREEFITLQTLRDTYLPAWYISAGTSRDYEIALEEWVSIVRIGTSAIKKEA